MPANMLGLELPNDWLNKRGPMEHGPTFLYMVISQKDFKYQKAKYFTSMEIPNE